MAGSACTFSAILLALCVGFAMPSAFAGSGVCDLSRSCVCEFEPLVQTFGARLGSKPKIGRASDTARLLKMLREGLAKTSPVFNQLGLGVEKDIAIFDQSAFWELGAGQGLIVLGENKCVTNIVRITPTGVFPMDPERYLLAPF